MRRERWEEGKVRGGGREGKGVRRKRRLLIEGPISEVD